MKVQDFLSASDVAIDIRAGNKAGLLKDLAARAASAVGLPVDAVSSEIAKRDELGSSGMGGGVSIPHARFIELKRPFGVLVRLEKAIDFDAIDGQPVDIVFFLLLPANSPANQLNSLAAVARRLRDREVLLKLRSASSEAELYRAMTT